MKTSDIVWCAALALASDTALAQMHQPAQPMPDPQAQSDLAAPHGESSGSSSDTSGASAAHSEAGMELAPAPASAARPKPQVRGDVTYLCGGVGAEEASYMKSEARGYDMMLTFAAQDGSYLANVNVDIRDAKGQPVLQAKCDAPIMLVDVPRSGTYRIRADTAGHILDRTAKVTAKHTKSARPAAVVLTWPQQVAEAAADTGDASSGGNTGSGKAGGGANGSGHCDCGQPNR